MPSSSAAEQLNPQQEAAPDVKKQRPATDQDFVNLYYSELAEGKHDKLTKYGVSEQMAGSLQSLDSMADTVDTTSLLEITKDRYQSAKELSANVAGVDEAALKARGELKDVTERVFARVLAKDIENKMQSGASFNEKDMEAMTVDLGLGDADGDAVIAKALNAIYNEKQKVKDPAVKENVTHAENILRMELGRRSNRARPGEAAPAPAKEAPAPIDFGVEQKAAPAPVELPPMQAPETQAEIDARTLAEAQKNINEETERMQKAGGMGLTPNEEMTSEEEITQRMQMAPSEAKTAEIPRPSTEEIPDAYIMSEEETERLRGQMRGEMKAKMSGEITIPNEVLPITAELRVPKTIEEPAMKTIEEPAMQTVEEPAMRTIETPAAARAAERLTDRSLIPKRFERAFLNDIIGATPEVRALQERERSTEKEYNERFRRMVDLVSFYEQVEGKPSLLDSIKNRGLENDIRKDLLEKNVLNYTNWVIAEKGRRNEQMLSTDLEAVDAAVEEMLDATRERDLDQEMMKILLGDPNPARHKTAYKYLAKRAETLQRTISDFKFVHVLQGDATPEDLVELNKPAFYKQDALRDSAPAQETPATAAAVEAEPEEETAGVMESINSLPRRMKQAILVAAMSGGMGWIAGRMEAQAAANEATSQSAGVEMKAETNEEKDVDRKIEDRLKASSKEYNEIDLARIMMNVLREQLKQDRILGDKDIDALIVKHFAAPQTPKL